MTNNSKLRFALALLVTLEAGLFFFCLRGCLGWIDLNFPGFLLIKNRVVAAAGCPFWEETRKPGLLHASLEAVNGTALRSAGDLYRIVAGLPRGSEVSYTLRERTGEVSTLKTRVHRFSALDFAALYGVYLLNGLLYLGVAAVCVWSWPRFSATRGLLAVGVVASLWAFTACDLYGPYRLFRLHILAESLLPASILHLALVFPEAEGRLRARPYRLAGLYLAFLLFGLAYEGAAYRENVYPVFNRTATAFLSLSLLVVVCRWLCAYVVMARTLRATRSAAAARASLGRRPAPAIRRLDPKVEAARKVVAPAAVQPQRSTAGLPAPALRNLLVFSVLALGPSIGIAAANAIQGFPPVSYLGYSSFLLPLGLALAAVQSGRPRGTVPAAGVPEKA